MVFVMAILNNPFDIVIPLPVPQLDPTSNPTNPTR